MLRELTQSAESSSASPTTRWTARLEELEAHAAATRARADQDAVAHMAALVTLGQLYLEAGNAPKALTQFEEGLALAQQHGDRAAEARLWGFKGMTLLKLGNANFAQRSLFRSLKLAQETEQTGLVIDALTRVAELHAITGRQSKAIARLEQAYGLAIQAEEHTRQMLAAGQLGDIFLGMEATDKALEYYAAAMEKAAVTGNQRAEAAFQVGVGDVLLAEGDHAQATEQFEAALDLADAQQDVMAQLRALNGLVRTQIATERSSLALLYGDRMVQIAREIGDAPTEIMNLNLLITFLLQQGQLRKALPYLTRGLEIAQEQDDWSWQLSMLTNLGYVRHENEELAAALESYKAALHWAEQLQDQIAIAQLLGRIGAVLADSGDPQGGVEAVQKALALAQASDDGLPSDSEEGSSGAANNQALIGEQQILLAFLYHDLGKQDQALAYCREALATFNSIGDDAFATQAEALLAQLS